LSVGASKLLASAASAKPPDSNRSPRAGLPTSFPVRIFNPMFESFDYCSQQLYLCSRAEGLSV